MSRDVQDLVIAGSGVAGLSAAVYAAAGTGSMAALDAEEWLTAGDGAAVDDPGRTSATAED